MVGDRTTRLDMDANSNIGSGRNGEVKKGRLITGDNFENSCNVAIKEFSAEYIYLAFQ